jgi:hypothetical protein
MRDAPQLSRRSLLRGAAGLAASGPVGSTLPAASGTGGGRTPSWQQARAAEGEPADAYLRLCQAAYPRSAVDRFYAGIREGGFDYGQEGQLFDVTGVLDGQAGHVPAVPVRSVDTTAAGDAFCGGLADVLADGASLPTRDDLRALPEVAGG